MKTPNDKRADKRISSILSAVDRRAVEPDKRFLDELKARSTAEFVACCGNTAGPSEETAKAISIWRTIMQSRITKLATAAVIIIAAMIIVHQSGGSVTLTTIAIADISEAMKKVPWMRMTNRGFGGNIEGPTELLFGFREKIAASKDVEGNISLLNFSEHKSYTYDLEDRTITIDYLYEDDFPAHLSSALSLVESMQELSERPGIQVVATEGEYEGEKVQVQEISTEGMGAVARLYIQLDSKLLLAIEVNVTDPNGNETVAGGMTFDYPQTGPANIYDLGVPPDARIIDKLPKEDFQKIWDNYRQKRAQATSEYIALITRTNSSFGGIIMTVYADYKSGEDHRHENHSVFTFKQLNKYDKFWPGHKEQLGDSHESLLAWTNNHFENKGSISVHLYDGQNIFSTRREDKGSWSKLRTSMSNRNLMTSDYLEWLGWPHIFKDAQIIEDDYARQNNLICIERLQQGSVYSGIVSPPGRFVYYLDPQKDYICRRKITERRPGAEWQEDENWLDGVEPDKIRNGSITVHDTTEIIQAPNGHWYPKVILIKQSGSREDYSEAPLHVSNITTVYLQTNPEFPDDIFNAEKLPGQ